MEKKIEYMFETSYYKYVYGLIGFLGLALIAVHFFVDQTFLHILTVLIIVITIASTKNLFSNDMALNKNKKRLLKSGAKYEGIITGYEKRSLLSSILNNNNIDINNDSYIYTLTVEYDGKTITTPPIIYNPEEHIHSSVCTVYADDKGFYVTDFNKTNDNFKIKEIVKNTEQIVSEE